MPIYAMSPDRTARCSRIYPRSLLEESGNPKRGSAALPPYAHSTQNVPELILARTAASCCYLCCHSPSCRKPCGVPWVFDLPQHLYRRLLPAVRALEAGVQ
jgi:hypothetical protein